MMRSSRHRGGKNKQRRQVPAVLSSSIANSKNASKYRQKLPQPNV
jgi:hypothetical protein